MTQEVGDHPGLGKKVPTTSLLTEIKRYVAIVSLSRYSGIVQLVE